MIFSPSPTLSTQPRMVRILHNGLEKSVMLFAGIVLAELDALLLTMFNLSSASNSVVGLTSSDGMVMPLSLCALSPDLIPKDAPCGLLVARVGGLYTTTTALPPPPLVDTKGGTDSNSSKIRLISNTNEGLVENMSSDLYKNVIGEISRFIGGLCQRSILSPAHVALLEALLHNKSSTLLYAAYSVAVRSNDAEYFAGMCLDVAQTLETDDGRDACSAQDEVLLVCDRLFRDSKVTQNQLLLLRHMVLTRDEAVAVIYDSFQDSGDAAAMSAQLRDLVMSTPSLSFDSSLQEESYVQDGSFDDSTSSAFGPAVSARVESMLRSGRVSSSEATGLLEMVRQKNVLLRAAYETYEADGDLEGLQRTLCRAAKVEAGRKLSQSAAELSGSGNDRHLGEMELEELLAQQGVDNVWRATVPRRFMTIVFSSAMRGLFSADQGRLLCDLFEGSYDIVLNAWNEYGLKSDLKRLCDRLKAVIRGMHFDSGSKYESEFTRSSQESLGSGGDGAGSLDDLLMNDNDDDESDNDSYDLNEEKYDDEESDSDALDSYRDMRLGMEGGEGAAKLELLKHSLEMMRAQRLISQKEAAGLLEMALGGSALVSHAIDNYRDSDDLEEFFSSLQSLAKYFAGNENYFNDALVDEGDRPAGGAEATEGALLLGLADQRSIVDILCKNGALTELQGQGLLRMIEATDPVLHSAFLAYQDGKDIYRLIQALKAVLPAAADTLEYTDSNEDDDNDEDNDDDVRVGPVDSSGRVTVETAFLDIVQKMTLSHVETAALRLAIARDEPALKASLHAFREDLDEPALKEALVKISRETISQTISESGFDYFGDDSYKGPSVYSSYPTPPPPDQLPGGEDYVYADCGDDKSSEDESSEESSDAEEESKGGSASIPISPQSTRNHVFPVLISELIKEGLLGASDGSSLLELFHKGAPSVAAALDAYDGSGDIAALLDGLQEVLAQ